MNETKEEVTKTEWVNVLLERRHRKGISILVKAKPELEDFIKDAVGTGESVAVENYGKEWFAPEEGSSSYRGPLRVWRGNASNIDERYHLNMPGKWLFGDREVNLSFLRLVGISSPEGVLFYERRPYSEEEFLTFKTRLGTSLASFCREFMSTSRVSISVRG